MINLYFGNTYVHHKCNGWKMQYIFLNTIDILTNIGKRSSHLREFKYFFRPSYTFWWNAPYMFAQSIYFVSSHKYFWMNYLLHTKNVCMMAPVCMYEIALSDQAHKTTYLEWGDREFTDISITEIAQYVRFLPYHNDVLGWNYLEITAHPVTSWPGIHVFL